MTEEIKQTEKGALEFAQKVYGEDLADAMYLGTYGDSDEDLKDFERRQHIWWDYNAVIQSAFRRGKNEGIASRMKAKGIAIEDIVEITGLNSWVIEAL